MNTSFRITLRSAMLAAALVTSVQVVAQDTTSGLIGRLLDAKGSPVAGAKIKIVHVPSGTTSTATTDGNGRYSAQGLRVGGPYHIEAQAAAMHEVDVDNVFLNLGETATVNLSDAAATTANAQLEGVTVTANAAEAAVFNADNKGLSTTISREQLAAAVNADRSFQSIARLDPRISITDRDAGAISANGKNFRYNCITVDQVNAGDPFGLASNGLFSVGTPISPDVIDAYQLATSNFDVSTRGCVGANINAVSKSGTNDVHGSVYYAYRSADDDFMGKIALTPGGADQAYTGFKREWTSGFTVGGPILHDTLFFFLGYEESKRVGVGATSSPSDGSGGTPVTGLSTAFFNSVLQQAQTFGFNTGDRSFANLDDKRYLAKVDWNINDQHRAVFRYSETKEQQPVPTGSASSVTPNSNWYFNDRDTKSYLAQVFSDWSDAFSTELDLQHSDISALRGPLVGGLQPAVQVSVNAYPSFSPSTTLGTEYSSQVNALDITQDYAYLAGTWHVNEHTIKAGLNLNQDKVFNAFMQGAVGSYTYNTLANFSAGNWEEYTIKQPAPGFNLHSSQANFTKQQYGAFVQDTWQATDRLSLTYGIRFDAPRFPDTPTLNPCFAAAAGSPFTATNAAGATLCSVAKGGFGYANNATPSVAPAWQPRVSFNYDFDSEYKTQLRGGVGVFVSDVPTVWYSNTYGNPGTSIVTYDIVDTAANPAGTLLCSSNGKTFSKASGSTCAPGQIAYVKQAPQYSASNPLIPNSGTLVLGSSVAQMAVDTIDPNFKMPNTTQIALAFDRELPWMGVISSLELNYTKTNDDILYKNLNLGAPTLTLPDGRQLYCSNPLTCSSTAKANANPSFGNVTYLTNTHQGQSDTLTWSLRKPMADNWSAMLAFRVGHATDVNPGTSSVAYSNYQYRAFVNPNADVATTSNYNVAQRVLGSLTWQHRFFGDFLTQISAFADLHSGAPYSWVSGTDTDGSGISGRSLAYIPRSADDVEWATGTTDLQKQQFMSYVKNNPYLSAHMGQIAGRNAVTSPWVNQFDLSFRQQIPGIFQGDKGELRFDIFNVGNLLNSKWGVERRAAYPLTRTLADVSGYDPKTGKYIYSVNSSAYKDKNGNYQPGQLVVNEGQTPGAPVPSQRWSLMMTARYTF